MFHSYVYLVYQNCYGFGWEFPSDKLPIVPRNADLEVLIRGEFVPEDVLDHAGWHVRLEQSLDAFEGLVDADFHLRVRW